MENKSYLSAFRKKAAVGLENVVALSDEALNSRIDELRSAALLQL